MSRRFLGVAAVAALLVLSGCTTSGVGSGPAAPSTTADPSPPRYEAFAVDTGHTDGPAIEGGLTMPADATGPAANYATLVTDDPAVDRFDWSVLGDDARAFVTNTDFDAASVLVVQTFPASSVPDYRVESVAWDGDRVVASINRSARYATADITVETLLIRVHHDGPAPAGATVRTATGPTVGTGEGRVTERRGA